MDPQPTTPASPRELAGAAAGAAAARPATRVSVEQIVEDLGLWERPAGPQARPRVMLNMVSTVDGRATLDGRSGALSGSADRALFHGLRSAVDAVLVGAGTVRAERYGRIIPDAARSELRRARAQRGAARVHRLRAPGAGADIPLLASPPRGWRSSPRPQRACRRRRGAGRVRARRARGAAGPRERAAQS